MVAAVHELNDGPVAFSAVTVNGSDAPVGLDADTVAVVALVCVATGAEPGHTAVPPIAVQPSPATHSTYKTGTSSSLVGSAASFDTRNGSGSTVKPSSPASGSVFDRRKLPM